MLADLLKEQTLTNHQQLEKKLVAQIRSLTTEADYVKLLLLFYGYFGGLEDKINLYIGNVQLADQSSRRKTQAIADDILAMGAHPAAKASGADLPVIENTAQAFGAMYVIEGSTLGGSIISKMIAGKLGIEKGLSFFNGYGEASHEMWGAFKEVLNTLPGKDNEAVIAAANLTFLKFKDWIDLNIN